MIIHMVKYKCGHLGAPVHRTAVSGQMAGYMREYAAQADCPRCAPAPVGTAEDWAMDTLAILDDFENPPGHETAPG